MDSCSIIAYGAGNPGSVLNAIKNLGFDGKITSDPDEILAAERIIFPGVGNFGAVMEKIRSLGLDEIIGSCLSENRKFLGICVGLQVLFDSSEESPEVNGLGLFKGQVKRFTRGKIPQIGWNQVVSKNFELLPEGYAYFVNSYYVNPQNNDIILAECDYHGKFCAGIKSGNFIAVQFHPEKSGPYGLEFLRRWWNC